MLVHKIRSCPHCCSPPSLHPPRASCALHRTCTHSCVYTCARAASPLLVRCPPQHWPLSLASAPCSRPLAKASPHSSFHQVSIALLSRSWAPVLRKTVRMESVAARALFSRRQLTTCIVIACDQEMLIKASTSRRVMSGGRTSRDSMAQQARRLSRPLQPCCGRMEGTTCKPVSS